MKKLTLLAGLFLGLACNVNADQARGFYLGISAVGIQNDSLQFNETEDEKLQWFGGEVNIGYKYASWLGLDLRYGKTSGDQTVEEFGAFSETKFSIDSYNAVYYRPELINKDAKLYALIGRAEMDITSTVGDIEESTSESGNSYGIGVGWFLENNATFNIELRRLMEADDNEFDSISLGYDYRF